MRTRRVSYVSAPLLLALAACGSSSGDQGNDGDAAPSNGNDTGGGGQRDAGGKTGHDASSRGGDSGSTQSTPEAGTSPKDSSSPIDVGTAVEAGSPGQVDITFRVTATQGAQPISPYIYGVNDDTQVGNAHATLVRIGGNRLTAYNWENNASNAGSDYNFQNDGLLCTTVTCLPNGNTAGAYTQAVVEIGVKNNAATLVTVPIVDYVAADENGGGDVRNSGSNYLSTRFKQNKPAKGSAFAYPPDTTDAYVYEDEMVNWLTKTAEPTATLRFQLDNEPDLWSQTHAEVHPVPVTYAELAQRNIEYATAIKKVAPSAHVVGSVNYGWEGYITLQNATDSTQDGDYITWWLGQMKAAETSAGKRLLDGLDLHWYPEATGGGTRIIDDGTGAAEVAAREQAPRSLWDSTYEETSWIEQSLNASINLIPRIMGKISASYPGTKLSFSEWNYGGGTDISGGIATADVLGVFGVQGVDMATYWPLNGSENYAYAAFRAFRDYDGKGSTFGDTSIGATTTDNTDSSVYASLESSDTSKLVIVAINKATSSKEAGIVITHSTVYSKASVYTLTASGGANVVAAAGLTSTATNAFRYSMPAQSVSVLVPTP